MKKLFLISFLLLIFIFEFIIIYKFLNYVLFKSSVHEFTKISAEKEFFIKWIVWGVLFIFGSFSAFIFGRLYGFKKCKRIQKDIIDFSNQNFENKFYIENIPVKFKNYDFHLLTLFDFFSWKINENSKIKNKLILLQEKINNDFSKINVKDLNFN